MENKRSLYKLSEKAKKAMESGLANLAIHTGNTRETNKNKITSYFQDMAGNTASTTNWLCGDYPKQNDIELRNPEETNKNKITSYFQDMAGNTFSTTNRLCRDYPKQNNMELRNPEETNKNKITHYFQDVAGNKIYKKIEFNAE